MDCYYDSGSVNKFVGESKSAKTITTTAMAAAKQTESDLRENRIILLWAHMQIRCKTKIPKSLYTCHSMRISNCECKRMFRIG